MKKFVNNVVTTHLLIEQFLHLFFIGTISCSLSSAQQPDALIKVSAPHRRARSAAWSYHFYPEETWCNLTLHLPTAVLLSEVRILPHTAVLNSE